ncbi:MAG: PAS domain S-box protein [Spirochaetia bacterium]|nr:PAS domain S-box protein [Spirochaetia bacterium]
MRKKRVLYSQALPENGGHNFLDPQSPFREAFYQAIESNPYQTFVFFDTEKKVLAANPLARARSQAILGVDTLPGMDARDILRREDWPDFEKSYAAAMAGIATHREKDLLDPQGQHVYSLELSYFPIRDPSGKVGAVCFATYDITRLRVALGELKQARALLSEKVERRDLQLFDSIQRLHGEIRKRQAVEDQLRHSEHFFRSIFERAGVGMNIFDETGKILQTNAAFEAMLGYSPADFSGKNLGDYFHLDDRRFWLDKVLELMSGAATHAHFEKRLMHKNGTIVWAAMTITYFKEASESGARVLTIAENITERKSLEDQLIQSERLAAVGTLAGGVAHEFNNINMGILGYTELSLEKDGVPPIVREYLGKIRQNIMRANGVTGNLLAFSRPGSKERTPERMKVLCEETLALVEPQLSKDQVRVETSFDESDTAVVDRGAVLQVFLNLVINAIHAMVGRSEKVLTVKTSVETAKSSAEPFSDSREAPERRVKISFRDTGCGIPEALLGRIFIPFFSTKGEYARGSGQSLVKGSGLGLSVCHSIVATHRGEIRVESAENVGSTFTVIFPL